MGYRVQIGGEMKDRASGIVICEGTIYFVQQLVGTEVRHIFVGGGIENGETPEIAMKRELYEEMNINGEIVFGPVIVERCSRREHVFVIEIGKDIKPTLGCDPELPPNEQDLCGIVQLNLEKDIKQFNKFDMDYISTIITEARNLNYKAEWLARFEKLLYYKSCEGV